MNGLESYRKLIKFGNSSFVVSLPNKWVKMNKLEKGSVMNLVENGHNELILTPQGYEREASPKEIILDLKGKEEKEIQREIVSSYIYGYDIIRLKGVGKNLRKVRDIIYSLIGLEIVDQEQDLLVVRSLLSLKDISLDKHLRRIDTILKAMMEDSRKSYRAENYEYIKDRDRDINRISYLLLRVIKSYLANPSLQRNEKERYTSLELFNLWALLVSLEGIGDECKRVSRLYTTLQLNKKKIDFEAFDKLYATLCLYYNDIMKAYYKGDKSLAYQVASDSRNVFNLYESLLNKATNVHEASLIEKSKNLSSHIRGVARAVYEW